MAEATALPGLNRMTSEQVLAAIASNTIEHMLYIPVLLAEMRGDRFSQSDVYAFLTQLKSVDPSPRVPEIGMAIDLEQVQLDGLQPEGLVIQRVTTSQQIDAYAHMVAAHWDFPGTSVLAFYRQAAGLLLHPDCTMQLYVGYLHGEPVATSELFLGSEVAGLYCVSTLSPFRRRGIGAAMVRRSLLMAQQEGYKTAILQASKDIQAVYIRLGFKPYGPVSI